MSNKIKNLELIDVKLVENPVNPACRVTNIEDE